MRNGGPEGNKPIGGRLLEAVVHTGTPPWGPSVAPFVRRTTNILLCGLWAKVGTSPSNTGPVPEMRAGLSTDRETWEKAALARGVGVTLQPQTPHTPRWIIHLTQPTLCHWCMTHYCTQTSSKETEPACTGWGWRGVECSSQQREISCRLSHSRLFIPPGTAAVLEKPWIGVSSLYI